MQVIWKTILRSSSCIRRMNGWRIVVGTRYPSYTAHRHTYPSITHHVFAHECSTHLCNWFLSRATAGRRRRRCCCCGCCSANLKNYFSRSHSSSNKFKVKRIFARSAADLLAQIEDIRFEVDIFQFWIVSCKSLTEQANSFCKMDQLLLFTTVQRIQYAGSIPIVTDLA